MMTATRYTMFFPAKEEQGVNLWTIVEYIVPSDNLLEKNRLVVHCFSKFMNLNKRGESEGS